MADEDVATNEDEPVALEDPHELWFRQAEPNPVVADRGVAGKLLFRLRPSDGRMLSGARCTKQTAKGAHDEHLERGLKTNGTWALSVAEVRSSGAEHGLNLLCIDDSMIQRDPPAATGHTFVDFREIDDTKYRLVRASMLVHANRRGCVYKPPPPGEDSRGGLRDFGKRG